MKSSFQILAILSLFFALVLASRQRPVRPSLGGNNRIDSSMLVDCCYPLDGVSPLLATTLASVAAYINALVRYLPHV